MRDAEYTGDDALRGYLGVIGLFNAVVVAFVWLSGLVRRPIPVRVPLQDVLLIGVATHKLSRLVAKAEVTAPLRAPFTEFEEKGGPAEVEERPEGTGLRRAIGKLLTCPYCLDVWVAALFHFSLVLRPAPARLAGSILASVAVADFLQAAYVRAIAPAAQDQAQPPPHLFVGDEAAA